MLHISKINPMVRAVGTVGAVAAIAGGITFASLTSNTVALSPNTLDSATATLQIGLTNGNSCAGATNGPQTGLNLTGANALVPGVASTPFTFCLSNTSSIPLAITTAIPQTAFASDTGVLPSSVMLNMTCDNGGTSSGTLDQYTGGTPLGTVAAGKTTDCQATVTLDKNFTGQGVSSNHVPSFDIDFVGTQTNS